MNLYLNTFAWSLMLLFSLINHMAKSKDKFTETDTLKTLIETELTLLGVLNRFGISLGFGDKTVKTACDEDEVDCPTFLAVCNLMCNNDYTRFNISLKSIMEYLRKAHSYFLDFMLPSIRRKLIEAINCTDVNDIAFLLLKFYDEYVQEVHNHMNYENDAIFKYVSELLENNGSQRFRISQYSLNHESMADKLAELKDIFIYHYHVKDNELLTSALTDIIQCGNELTIHCEIENKLFIPEVERLEQSVKYALEENAEDNKVSESPKDILTEREKDIIRCFAKGMVNKQIADYLCLSVHTVTTYRRNISAKLNIHSPSGLTIYAILHNLININDVNLQTNSTELKTR